MKTLPAPIADFISCPRMHARMQRSSCRKSYRHANPRRKPKAGKGAIATYSANPSCIRCELGKQHAAGEVSTAPTVEPLVPLRSKKLWVQRKCKGCGAPMPTSRKSYCSVACSNDRSVNKLVDAVEELGGW